MKRLLGFAIVLAFGAGVVLAEDHPKEHPKGEHPKGEHPKNGDPAAGEHPKAPSHPGFEALKGLAGNWTGTFESGPDKGEATVNYKVTAGGNAVEETIFVGTPHEMVTLYFVEGGSLKLTHYCAIGNRPTMVCAPVAPEAGKPTVLRFACAPGDALEAQPHMHSGEFSIADADHVSVSWSMFVNGKAAGDPKKLSLTRTK